MSDNPGSPQQNKDLSPAKQALLEKRLQAAVRNSAEQPAILHRPTRSLTALSYGQEGLWFASQLDASSPVYNRPVALRLSGALDRKALRRALEEVLRRHEVLRGRIRIDLGRPLQETNSASELDLAVADLTSYPTAEREEKASQLVNQQARIPVNLAKAPLMRGVLYGLAECEHILLLLFHHITFDAWSEQVLLNELSVLYSAYSKGAPTPLPELTIQYSDYVAWQREQLQSIQKHPQLAYWKDRLKDRPPGLELPADFPRPVLHTNRGADLRFSIPAALTARLKALGLRQEATLSMVCLAAFLLLVQRYSGQTDGLIGMPVAGRTQVEMEGLIGLFINTLVLRCNLAGEPTVLEFLERLRQGTLEDLAHQNVPLERLVAELNPPRDASRTPFFQLMYNYKNIPARPVNFQGLMYAAYELDLEVAPFDLTLELTPQEEGIAGKIIYNTDLYHVRTIERISKNYLQLLQSLVANPELPVTRLTLLSEDERHECLVDWNRTGDSSSYAGDGTINFGGRIDDPVKLRGHRTELEEIDRLSLAGLKPSQTSASEYVAPHTPLEKALAKVWREILGVERVGLQDNFFELGGHSLLAMKLYSSIETTFGLDVSIGLLYESPILGDFAKALASLASDSNVLDSILEQLQDRERSANMIIPDNIPLSFAQQRLFFIQQFEPDGYVYNLAETFRVKGALNRSALEESLNEIVRRHASLRTIFQVKDGEPIQIVQSSLSVPLSLVDLSDFPEKERLVKAVEVLEADFHRNFDLSRDILLRPILVQLTAEDFLFQVTMHHIITDGWSMDIFFQELSGLYEAKCAGRMLQLNDLRFQYADFAMRQRRQLNGPALDDLLAYWTKQLAGAPVLLQLPADRPRPAVQSFKGSRVHFTLPKELSNRLKDLALKHNVTMFMLMSAALDVLLYRYTGQEDLLVGAPIANRISADIENLIGFFVNTLVLRTNLSGSPSFKELLKQVKRVSLEAYQHQDIPFEKLVEVLNPTRTRSHSPLFQVSLAFLTVPDNRLNLTGLEVEPFEIERGISHFDWTLFIKYQSGELSGSWEYNSDLFDRPTIERALGHYLTLLEAAAADPEQPIDSLPLLTVSERRQLLQEWNTPQVHYAKSTSLQQVFQEQVERNPEAMAVTALDAGSSAEDSAGMQSISYGELNRRANRLANHLRTLGVERGTLVGLCVQRSMELVVGILGILKAGGAYVPLDPDLPESRKAFILRETQSGLLLTQAALNLQIPDLPITTVYLDADQEKIDANSGEDLPVEGSADDPAYVIYTSGSTGKPKGVPISHYNVMRLFQATQQWFNFDEKDVWTLFHSFAFDFSVWEIWGALLYGGRLVVVSYWTSRTPKAFARLMSEQGVTVLNQTPSAFAPLLQIAEFLDPKKLSSLRLVIFGGEALNLQSLRPWFEQRGDSPVQLVNMYGITETTVHVTYRPIKAADLDGSGSLIGAPIPDLQVYLLDQKMQPVPIGVPGEIFVGGAGLSQGYLNRPDLSAERFIPNPFSAQPGERLYRSGDLARYLPNGELEYLGRRDHQVKMRGFRIELGEIEALLSEYPGVRQAVVLMRQDWEAESGEKSSQLVAYLVTDKELPTAELRNFLKVRLSEYMLPGAFVFLPELPLTSNGKVDRNALPKPTAQGFLNEQEYLTPLSAFEQILSRLWAEALNIERVGLTDNFFQLGGHSLLAIRIIYRIEDLFDMKLELQTLFDNPVFEDFTRLILENSTERDRIEQVAELLLELADLSDEDAKRILSGQAKT